MAEAGEPKVTIEEAFRRGVNAFEQGDLPMAERWFRTIIEVVPMPRVRWWLARTLNMMERCEEADREFEAAVGGGLEPALDAYYRGIMALRAKDFEAAERFADAALAAQPGFDEARLQGVRALGARGLWREAAEKYGQDAADTVADETYGRGFLNPFSPQRMLRQTSAAQRKAVDDKPILPNAPIGTLLRKLPADWVHSIAANLGLPQRRKVADAIQDVAATLPSPGKLASLMASLSEEEQAALRWILSKGGAMTRQAFARPFRDDRDDSFWVREEPPRSVLGRLRDRGLVFVGRAPSVSARGVVLVIPAALRPLLSEALGMPGE